MERIRAGLKPDAGLFRKAERAWRRLPLESSLQAAGPAVPGNKLKLGLLRVVRPARCQALSASRNSPDADVAALAKAGLCRYTAAPCNRSMPSQDARR